MTSRRKQIQEQMARTKDPLVQMQLKELLNKKRQRRDGILDRIDTFIDSLWGPTIRRMPVGARTALFVVIVTTIVFVIFAILEWLA
jgi:hypothetical protein